MEACTPLTLALVQASAGLSVTDSDFADGVRGYAPVFGNDRHSNNRACHSLTGNRSPKSVTSVRAVVQGISVISLLYDFEARVVRSVDTSPRSR